MGSAALKIFTPIAGALGDVLENYLDGELGYFRALKSAGAVTAVKLWAVNNQSPELFRFNPYVDHVLTEPFALAAGRTGGFRAWAAKSEPTFRLMTDAEHALPWERPQFFLSPPERQVAAEIEAAGPYVALHLFAGKPERRLDSIALHLIEHVSRHARFVILGGDSTRTEYAPDHIREHSPVEDGLNLFNLVNKHSVRLHAHLASKAARFIGSVSAYNSVAQSCGVPALIFGSPQNRRDMIAGGSVFKKMRDNRTRIYYLDDLPDVPRVVGEFLK